MTPELRKDIEKRQEFYQEYVLKKYGHYLGRDTSQYVITAMDEILSHMVMTQYTEKRHDAIIDKCGQYLMDNYNIKEDDINWQEIESWIYSVECNLTHYFNDKKILKILQNMKWKGKFTEDDDLQINSKELDIDEVYETCYKELISLCEFMGENSVINEFTNKELL